ncbi:hypothetical protein AgCh_004652 [Apium graveolens]
MNRNRAPGNGYRSPMGMGGGGPASRISPDGGGRGNGMYNSEYRGYNRGFGRGQPKPFQPPQPQPRKGDVFTEAGRLATEYLVSKGILPQNVYSGKWQNGGIKNLVGSNLQGPRPQDIDPQTESRPSALGRLGDGGINDMGTSSKRRFPEESNMAESRDYLRGKRRMESFRHNGAQGNQELGRSMSWSEKSGVSPDKDSNGNAFEYQEEQQVSKERISGEQKSQSGDIASKNDNSCHPESPHEKNQVTDDMASKASSSSTEVNHPSGSDPHSSEKPKDIDFANLGTGDVKGGNCDIEMEKLGVIENSSVSHSAEDNPESKNGSNLLRLCTFAKVPTRIRSSLTIKASKAGSLSIAEDVNTSDSGLCLVTGTSVEAQNLNGPSGNDSVNQIQSLKVDHDVSNLQTKEDAADQGTGHELELGKCTRSRSFPDRSLEKEQGLNEGAAGYGRSNTMDSWKGEIRSMQHRDSRDDFKKTREWDPLIDTQADLSLSNSVQNPEGLVEERNQDLSLSNSVQHLKGLVEGRNLSGEEGTVAAERKELLDISLTPSGVAKPETQCTEEKQLISGSFKICDLNLMGASDLHENHDDHPVVMYPSNLQKRKNEAGHVDISLSMSNNCITPDKFCTRGANGEEVEVIDLENDCIQDMALNNPDQKDEALFTGLDSLTNNSQNVNDISGVQDGYGLMISELLGNDMPNCSSVPPDVNSLHSEMGLNNGEGILGEDDSIYMSLEEIPISFLRGWEQQPPQEYDKPF